MPVPPVRQDLKGPMGGIVGLVSSDNLRAAADIERLAHMHPKRIQVPYAGTVRVTYELRASGSGPVPRVTGTVRSGGGGSVSFTTPDAQAYYSVTIPSLTVGAGDSVELSGTVSAPFGYFPRSGISASITTRSSPHLRWSWWLTDQCGRYALRSGSRRRNNQPAFTQLRMNACAAPSNLFSPCDERHTPMPPRYAAKSKSSAGGS